MVILRILSLKETISKLASLRSRDRFRDGSSSAESIGVPLQLHDYESMIQCFGSRVNGIIRIGRIYPQRRRVKGLNDLARGDFHERNPARSETEAGDGGGIGGREAGSLAHPKLLHSKTRSPSPQLSPVLLYFEGWEGRGAPSCNLAQRSGCEYIVRIERSNPRGAIISPHFISEFVRLHVLSVLSRRRFVFAHCITRFNRRRGLRDFTSRLSRTKKKAKQGRTHPRLDNERLEFRAPPCIKITKIQFLKFHPLCFTTLFIPNRNAARCE